MLAMSETELAHMVSLVDRYHGVTGDNKPAGRVRFHDDHVTCVANFLSCFSCSPHAGEGELPGQITLVKDLPDDRKMQLGE